MRLLLFLYLLPLSVLAQEIETGLGTYYYRQEFRVKDDVVLTPNEEKSLPSHYSGYSYNLEVALRHKHLYTSISLYRYDLYFQVKGHFSAMSGIGLRYISYDIDYKTRFSFGAYRLTVGVDPLKGHFRIIPCLSLGREFRGKETASSDRVHMKWTDVGDRSSKWRRRAAGQQPCKNRG